VAISTSLPWSTTAVVQSLAAAGGVWGASSLTVSSSSSTKETHEVGHGVVEAMQFFYFYFLRRPWKVLTFYETLSELIEYVAI
jgi:hypothetical protein